MQIVAKSSHCINFEKKLGCFCYSHNYYFQRHLLPKELYCIAPETSGRKELYSDENAWQRGKKQNKNKNACRTWMLNLKNQMIWRWSSGGGWGSWQLEDQQCEARPETSYRFLPTIPSEQQCSGWNLFSKVRGYFRHLLVIKIYNKIKHKVKLTSKDLFLRN